MRNKHHIAKTRKKYLKVAITIAQGGWKNMESRNNLKNLHKNIAAFLKSCDQG